MRAGILASHPNNLFTEKVELILDSHARISYPKSFVSKYYLLRLLGLNSQ